MDSSKVEIVIQSFDKLASKISEPKPSNIWETLIPLLIGAALTFFAQWSIEWWKSKKDRGNKKQELISKSRAKAYLISQILKKLSMYKAHKQYYIAAMDLELNSDRQDDFYGKHYEKGQEQRETETKLDDTIAEYFQILAEYQVISKRNNLFKDYFKKITDFEHPKPQRFNQFTNAEELEKCHSIEEKRLNEEYGELRRVFDEIQELMQSY